MQIIKDAQFEDDSYYIVIGSEEVLADVKDIGYLNTKRKAFRELDPSVMGMGEYSGRSSFGESGTMKDFAGSVYTHTVGIKNGLYYKELMQQVRWNKDLNRRCVVRVADSFVDYQKNSCSTSCLNIMHFHKDKVVLFFRASDIEHELLYDLHLIKEFFLDLVWDKCEWYEIHVIASTAQGIGNGGGLNRLIK